MLSCNRRSWPNAGQKLSCATHAYSRTSWVAHDNFLPAFGQLRLLQESMHQIEVFIQQTHRSKPSSTGMIVALHANKPHGMGNIHDHQQSPTAAFLKACQGQFLSPHAQMLVLEAMPLQQFPGRCGHFEGRLRLRTRSGILSRLGHWADSSCISSSAEQSGAPCT